MSCVQFSDSFLSNNLSFYFWIDRNSDYKLLHIIDEATLMLLFEFQRVFFHDSLLLWCH